MTGPEYRHAKLWADRFEKAAKSYNPSADVHPLLVKAITESLQGQAKDLRKQISEFDAIVRRKQFKRVK